MPNLMILAVVDALTLRDVSGGHGTPFLTNLRLSAVSMCARHLATGAPLALRKDMSASFDALMMYNPSSLEGFSYLIPPVPIGCTNQSWLVPGWGDFWSPACAWYHDGLSPPHGEACLLFYE